MKQWTKIGMKYGGAALVLLVLIAAWMLYLHNNTVAAALPKWDWLQGTVKKLGQAVPVVAEEDEDPDNTKNSIPVKVAKVTTETLHQYIESIGVIAPAPPRLDKPAGSAAIASPAAGVVSTVVCQIGQKVHAGDPLIQLDDRLAKANEEQAAAALAQAEASLAALNANPKPELVAVNTLAVDKAKSALDFAKHNMDRITALAADQGASVKALEQAKLDLASAQNDLLVAQKQLDLLQSAPTPEAVNQEKAKVAQAKAALASAQTQLKMTTIAAPIDATVAALCINPGEAVDPTKTLVTLIALDRLTVDVDVPSDELPDQAQGLPAEVRITAQKATDDAIVGKVAFVSPEVDPRNGAVTLSIDLPADSKLRPGLAVRVRIITGEHKNILAVPKAAVIPNENLDKVICVVDGEQATHKSVQTGFEENGLIEVSGFELKAGDTVVTSGAFGLSKTQATHVKVEQ